MPRRGRRKHTPTRAEIDRSEIRFLNVDLQICSKQDLSALVAAFGKRLLVLCCEKHKRKY